MTHAVYYRPVHESQYQPGASARTRSSGCTWTAGSVGADAATGGRIDPEPDRVLAMVKPSEETNPATPGWSLADLDLAMTRLGVPFTPYRGRGWAAVSSALDAGLYIVLQGDSDQFEAGSCSGTFDGDHAIGVHPERDALGRQWINDPICPGGRWASRAILRRYAEKFNPAVSFGVFTTPVPELIEPHIVLDAPTPSERNAMIASATPGRTMSLAKGQPLFRHPGGPRVTRMADAGKAEYVGHAGGAWGAVRIKTGIPYRDGKTRPTVLYVPLAAGSIT